MKKITKLIYVLVGFLIVFSGYNFYLGEFSSDVCIIGDGSCSFVQNSKYGSIFGIKVSLIGFLAFIGLGFLYHLSKTANRYRQNFREAYLVAVVLGLIGSLYFISIQFFVLKEICINCLIIDGTMILVSFLSFYESYKRNHS